MTPLSVRDVAASLPPDAALASRDQLLDERVAAVFERVLPATGTMVFDRVERVRVKYRIGESLRTLHRVWCGSRSWLVSGRMRASAPNTSAAPSVGRTRPCGPLRGAARCHSLGTTFWTFPNDRIIRNVDALRADLPLVAQLLPGGPFAAEIVSFKPERAVIGSIVDREGRPVAFAKLFAPGGSEAPARILHWLASAIDRSGSPLTIARLRAAEPRLDLLVLDSAGTRHMADLPDDRINQFFCFLGSALGHLHLLPPPPFDRFARFDSSRFGRVAELVEWVRPDLGSLVRQAVRRLDRTRPADGDIVCVHGDMNPGNWIAPEGSVALIDFDQATSGPAAADVGAVLAWLRTRTLTGYLSMDRERELAGSLLDGYAAVRAVPPFRDLLWFRAAALLAERTVRAITRFRTEQLACLGDLVRTVDRDAQECTHA